MIVGMAFFDFPNPVNDKAARTVATGVVAISVLTLVTGWWWLLVPLGLGFLGRVLADWPEEDLVDLDRLLTRLAADLAADAQSATHPPSTLQTSGRTAS